MELEWIKHEGGDCPVAPDTYVLIQFPDGDKTDSPMQAEQYRWHYINSISDIVAYAVVDKDGRPLPKAEPEKASVNPKQAVGLSKLPLHLASPLAIAYMTVGLANGAGKYGMGNYKGTEVILSIYLSATMRHLLAFLEGQECDPVEGVPHLAAVLANMAIILDARAAGTLIDDRPIQGGYLQELDMLTKIYQNLVKMHEGRNPRHYTQADNRAGAIT